MLRFRQCHSWLEDVRTTSSQQSTTSPTVIDKHFVSGVHLGVGVFNVVRSVFVAREMSGASNQENYC